MIVWIVAKEKMVEHLMKDTLLRSCVLKTL